MSVRRWARKTRRMKIARAINWWNRSDKMLPPSGYALLLRVSRPATFLIHLMPFGVSPFGSHSALFAPSNINVCVNYGTINNQWPRSCVQSNLYFNFPPLFNNRIEHSIWNGARTVPESRFEANEQRAKRFPKRINISLSCCASKEIP